jgi:hypothetical protein
MGKTGRIWYATLHDSRLRNDADFASFATLTIDNAGHLFAGGPRKAPCATLGGGWRYVALEFSSSLVFEKK